MVADFELDSTWEDEEATWVEEEDADSILD